MASTITLDLYDDVIGYGHDEDEAFPLLIEYEYIPAVRGYEPRYDQPGDPGSPAEYIIHAVNNLPVGKHWALFDDVTGETVTEANLVDMLFDLDPRDGE